ncbi:MAG: hypothetical protein L6Q40_07510 [Azonexus sp.]|nr:hypothetical protein [Azonexus sp.]
MAIRFPATILVFAAVLWVKAIYPASSGIADTDFFWHLTYGQWIIENGAIPAGDIFSWTFSGHPYQLTQWFGEALMGLAYNAAGLDGTKLISVALTAITIGFAWLAAKRFVHTSMALGIAILCNLVHIVTPMRPQLFTFALLAIGAWMVTSYIATRRMRYLAAYPVMMVLWVNLHGGFVTGLMLIGLVALGLTAEAFMKKTLREEMRGLAMVWGVVCVSTLATLLNPYGANAILTVLMIGGLRSASVISEWMPVNLTTELGWFYLLNLVPYVAVMAVSGVRPRLSHGLIAGFFLVFGVLANRQVAMCAAVMAPFMAALLARTPHYEKLLASCGNPNRPLAHGLIAAALAASFPAIAAKGNGTWAATLNNQYPIEATNFLVQHNLTDRVMSDTLEASYLIHRGVPVFVDGRMDLYRDQFYFEWYLASRATPGWDALVERHAPQAMLLRLDMAIRQAALASGKWKQVYEDARYSVLVPASFAIELPEVRPAEVTYLDGKGKLIRPYMP